MKVFTSFIIIFLLHNVLILTIHKQILSNQTEVYMVISLLFNRLLKGLPTLSNQTENFIQI